MYLHVSYQIPMGSGPHSQREGYWLANLRHTRRGIHVQKAASILHAVHWLEAHTEAGRKRAVVRVKLGHCCGFSVSVLCTSACCERFMYLLNVVALIFDAYASAHPFNSLAILTNCGKTCKRHARVNDAPSHGATYVLGADSST